MPSHIKSSMLGTSLVLPVHKGRIQTGTWQGIWLGNIASTADRVASSRHYKGSKNDHFELLQYCMAKPGAEQSVHNDWKATQIKVEDVLFAMVKEVENRPAVSLKTSPELAELLRQQHSDVRPSRHLNKAHWSTVYLDGSLPDSQIYYLVDASYQQAVNLLPEEKRKLLVQL